MTKKTMILQLRLFITVNGAIVLRRTMKRVCKVQVISCSLCWEISAERVGSRMVFQPCFSRGRCRADAAPKEKPSVLCRGVGLQVASRFRRTNKRVMRYVDGVVPRRDAERRRGKRRKRKRFSKEFARRALLEYHASYIYAGVHSSSALKDLSGAFRNVSSRWESVQVFRVRDVRDCAMGPDASSILVPI